MASLVERFAGGRLAGARLVAVDPQTGATLAVVRLDCLPVARFLAGAWPDQASVLRRGAAGAGEESEVDQPLSGYATPGWRLGTLDPRTLDEWRLTVRPVGLSPAPEGVHAYGVVAATGAPFQRTLLRVDLRTGSAAALGRGPSPIGRSLAVIHLRPEPRRERCLGWQPAGPSSEDVCHRGAAYGRGAEQPWLAMATARHHLLQLTEIAQTIQARGLELATRAGIDPFEISLSLFVRVQPHLAHIDTTRARPCSSPSPLEYSADRGAGRRCDGQPRKAAGPSLTPVWVVAASAAQTRSPTCRGGGPAMLHPGAATCPWRRGA